MLLAVAILCGLIFYQFIQSLNTSEAIVRANSILDHANDVLSEVEDAETGQRGFLLTGRDDYLILHNEAVAILYKKLGGLQQVVAGNSRLGPQAEIIHGLVEQNLDELGETIQLRRRAGLETALNVVTSDRGKSLTDQIRQVILSITNKQVILSITNKEEYLLASARSVQAQLRARVSES
jgi:CHASE3 domain sensor protein